MNYLLTGVAGFIGHKVGECLLRAGHHVVGIDNLNDYYDVGLKRARLQQSEGNPQFHFEKINITEGAQMQALFAKYRFERVIHLAAQAGVRYSLQQPMAYINSNIVGFMNILEGCRHCGVKHLVYASSSSVYGANKHSPFKVSDFVDTPISLYAASKKANELMAYTYSHLYQLPTTGLRFFTVYGPWGRPDMATFKFTQAILQGKAIDIYNHGNMSRDFTYIDDIATGVLKVADVIPTPKHAGGSDVPYRLYNIGRGEPVNLMDFIGTLERLLGRQAKKNFLPLQAGDVLNTYADITDLYQATGYRPKVSISEGMQAFVDWYREFYSI